MNVGTHSRAEQRARAAADTRPRTTLSFYRYVHIPDPEAFRDRLVEMLERFDCRGRIYIAREGINAQMNVPGEHFTEWKDALYRIPELADVPLKIAVEERDVPSFYKLTVKIKQKIVADGLDDSSFDVTDTGAYLTPEEMNEYINDPDAVVVDMRNSYESEIGHFTGAVTPDVETFRDELSVAPELLRVHKNKKIALYCTGGIRCEKASAWLKHNGFQNVRHLKGGIIDYARAVKEQGITNYFLGSNFVFDERLGERIGDEVISTCHLCGTNPSDRHYHCGYQPCHILFLGCDACMERTGGYCSWMCRLLDRLPKRYQKLHARYKNMFFKPKQFKKCRLRPEHVR